MAGIYIYKYACMCVFDAMVVFISKPTLEQIVSPMKIWIRKGYSYDLEMELVF